MHVRRMERIVQIAFLKGSRVQLDLMPLMLKRLTLTGSTLRPRKLEFKARHRDGSSSKRSGRSSKAGRSGS